MSAADRAVRLGGYFAVLDVAHDGADHVVQTDHQAARKAADWWAMAGHVCGYQVCQALALAGHWALTGRRPSWARLAAATALSAGTHAFLDRRWPVAWILRVTGSPRFAEQTFIVKASISDQVRPSFLGASADAQEAVARATHPVPLAGRYLADQALHRLVLLVCAAILAGGEHR